MTLNCPGACPPCPPFFPASLRPTALPTIHLILLSYSSPTHHLDTSPRTGTWGTYHLPLFISLSTITLSLCSLHTCWARQYIDTNVQSAACARLSGEQPQPTTTTTVHNTPSELAEIQ
eukprot:5766615-Amphidinium_carterae.3